MKRCLVISLWVGFLHPLWAAEKADTLRPAGPSLDELAIAISSQDSKARVSAIQALWRMGPAAKPAIPVLLQAADDPNTVVETSGTFRIGHEAIKAIRRIDPTYMFPEEFVAKLIKQAKSPPGRKKIQNASIANCTHQPAAIMSLGLIGHSAHAALPDLVRLARKPCGESVARQAMEAIGQATPEQLEIIYKGISDDDADVRLATIEYLSATHSEAPEQTLVLGRALNDRSSAVRLAAVEALEKIHPEGAGRLSVLSPLLNDASRSVREGAVYAVAQLQNCPEATALLREALKDPERGVVLSAARMLIQRDASDPFVVQTLIDASHNATTPEGRDAADILETLPVRTAAVAKALEPYHEEERHRLARRAIAATTPQQRLENARTLKVLSIKMAKDVLFEEPSRTGTVFRAGPEPLYCWTELSISTPPVSLLHVWYLKNEKMAEYQLDIVTPTAKAWSHHKVKPGSWRVLVQTAAASEPLATIRFDVIAGTNTQGHALPRPKALKKTSRP